MEAELRPAGKTMKCSGGGGVIEVEMFSSAKVYGFDQASPKARASPGVSGSTWTQLAASSTEKEMAGYWERHPAAEPQVWICNVIPSAWMRADRQSTVVVMFGNTIPM
jgi:hypothetical protein